MYFMAMVVMVAELHFTFHVHLTVLISQCFYSRMALWYTHELL